MVAEQRYFDLQGELSAIQFKSGEELFALTDVDLWKFKRIQQHGAGASAMIQTSRSYPKEKQILELLEVQKHEVARITSEI